MVLWTNNVYLVSVAFKLDYNTSMDTARVYTQNAPICVK